MPLSVHTEEVPAASGQRDNLAPDACQLRLELAGVAMGHLACMSEAAKAVLDAIDLIEMSENAEEAARLLDAASLLQGLIHYSSTRVEAALAGRRLGLAADFFILPLYIAEKLDAIERSLQQ